MTDIVSWGDTPVATLVTDTVASISPQATLLDAADLLAARDVGVLVVGDGGRPPEAVVSERDLVRALAARRDPATTPVRAVAHTDLIWCDVEATLAEVANEMMDRYVRHVLVEEDGRLVGIVSARDLLGAYAAADMADQPEDEDRER